MADIMFVLPYVLCHGFTLCDHTDTHMEVVISDIVVVLSLTRVFDDKYC